MIEKIENNNVLIAIIIPADHTEADINFFTPSEFSQQLAYMNRPAGYKIAPHVHNRVSREVFFTQEVLFIKKGKVRVDLYDQCRNHITTRILSEGDVIMLASGGHGFEILEPTEMIEVKQGPYAGENDKTRFVDTDRYSDVRHE